MSEPTIENVVPAPTPTANVSAVAASISPEILSQLERAQRERDEAAARAADLQKHFEEQAAQLKALSDAAAAREKAEADALAAQQTAAEKAAEEELSAKELLAKRDAQWAEEKAELQRQTEQRFHLLQLENQAVQLQAYVQSKIAESAADKSIHPSLYDYITGSSKEEIDASISLAKAKTAALFDEFKQTTQQRRQSLPGISTATGPTSMGSVTEGVGQEINKENLSFEDYITKVRPTLKIGGGGTGIFG